MSEETIIFRGERSSASAGMITFLVIISALAIVFFFMLLSAEFGSWRWMERAFLTCIFAAASIYHIRRFMMGHKTELIVSTVGIKYGSTNLPWHQIAKIHPFGGSAISGNKEYIVCYEERKSVFSGSYKLWIDKRLTTEEFHQLCDQLRELVLPHHPHLKIKEP